jgi:putative spermidine/putrescine transport system ATP-binding protein
MMSDKSPVSITLRQITKRYGSTCILNNIDLDIKSGEFLTLLGPSGSGKTTLLTVLAGLTRPDGGSLKFGETEVVCTPPHKRDVGMVFQNYALFPHMTVAGNVGFSLRLRGMKRAEMNRRVEHALEMVRLGGYGHREVQQLSGGQCQRVALARALVFEPRILLMDEPLSALDKQLREEMQIELRQLHNRLGMTTVYVTHDQHEALTMSDRIAVINCGRIIQVDRPYELYERPSNCFVAKFIGESSLIPIEVRGGLAELSGVVLETPIHPGCDGPRMLMLRPERLKILAGGTGVGVNILTARVLSTLYQGDSFLVQAALANGRLVSVRHPSNPHLDNVCPAVGDMISLGLAFEDTVLLPQDGLQ